MMMRVLPLSVLVASLSAALLAPALAGPGAELTLEQPARDGSGALILRGASVIQIRLNGGVGGASRGAFHLRAEGEWVQGAAVPISPAGEDVFRSEPFETSGYINGGYELEVRVWDEVPAYDPSDPTTYTARIFRVSADNPGVPPERIQGVAGVGAVRLSWSPPAGTDRLDFQGYRVWIAPGFSCPDAADAYELLGEQAGPGFVSAGIEPGRSCFRVTSARASDVTGTIDSAFSQGLPLLIPATGAQAAQAAGATRARPAPALEAPALPLADPPEVLGTFEERLPYGPASAAAPVELAEEDVRAEASVLPRADAARSLAMGSILLLGGVQVRVFLRKGRVR